MKTIFLILLSAILACSKSNTSLPENFLIGKRMGQLKDKRLSEASGLAASINNPDCFWTQNDSDNGAQVFLVDKELEIKMVCTLSSLENRDWEDIAVGPGPEKGKSYIYVGDIGDNDAKYSFKHIYRFEEPIFNKTHEILITQFDTITFKLCDKKKDTEALLIDPVTKDLYVVSKREEPVYLYQLRYPYSTHDTLVADTVARLPFTQITAGSISPDGTEILLKNYDEIYYWHNPEMKDIAYALMRKPKILPYEPEVQGEAITWAKDALGFYTISESGFFNKATKGRKIYLMFYQRK